MGQIQCRARLRLQPSIYPPSTLEEGGAALFWCERVLGTRRRWLFRYRSFNGAVRPRVCFQGKCFLYLMLWCLKFLKISTNVYVTFNLVRTSFLIFFSNLDYFN